VKGPILIILFLVSLTSLPTKSHASQQESLLKGVTYQNGKFIPTHLLDNSQSTVLYKGQQVTPSPISPVTNDTIKNFLAWLYNVDSFEDFVQAYEWGDGTVESFMANIQEYYGTSDLLPFILDMDQEAFLQVEGEGNPLALPYPQTTEDFAGFTQQLRQEGGNTLFNYYRYRVHPSSEVNDNTVDENFAQTWIQNIDWEGMNTTGFNFESLDLRNTPITGAQLTQSGSDIADVQTDGMDLNGFNPADRFISGSAFKNATNLNVDAFLNSSAISNMDLTGAKTPDGTTITKTMFQNAMQSKWGPSGLPYPPGDWRNNYFNIDSITFSE
jgi:hypothetical protein